MKDNCGTEFVFISPSGTEGWLSNISKQKAGNWDQFSLLHTDLNKAPNEHELAGKNNKWMFHSVQHFSICQFSEGTQSYSSNSKLAQQIISHICFLLSHLLPRNSDVRNAHVRAKELHLCLSAAVTSCTLSPFTT